MSSAYESSLSTHQEWSGQYSYLPQEESAVFGPPFDQHHDPAAPSRSPRTVAAVPASIDAVLKRGTSPVSEQARRDVKPNTVGKAASAESGHITAEDEMYTVKRPDQVQDGSTTSADTPAMSMGSTHLSSVSSTGHNLEPQSSQILANDKGEGLQDDEEEMAEDDDMIDIEGDQPSRPMTAAERTAARRKMKRFR